MTKLTAEGGDKGLYPSDSTEDIGQGGDLCKIKNKPHFFWS